MDKIDIEKLLTIMDNGAKEAFIAMPRENQLLVLLSIEMSNSNRLAKVEKKQIDMETDVKVYRIEREREEKRREGDSDDHLLNTTQKMLKILAQEKAKEFNWGIYFRDRVLPNILSPAIIILLYLIFTQLKP